MRPDEAQVRDHHRRHPAPARVAELLHRSASLAVGEPLPAVEWLGLRDPVWDHQLLLRDRPHWWAVAAPPGRQTTDQGWQLLVPGPALRPTAATPGGGRPPAQ